MFTTSVCRKVSLCVFHLSFLWLGTAHGQQFQTCEEALATAGGAVSLTDAATSTTTKKVDEWESDIVKIDVARPGVVVLAGEGPGVQGSLYSGDESPSLEDTGPLGSAHRPLTVVVGPGEHCVRVTPPEGSTGTLRLRTTFFDVCGLGPQDDHGDSFLCATEIEPGQSADGEIEDADQDVFFFVLGSTWTVTIALSGATDLALSLSGEDGSLLAADALGDHTLGTGRYFVRVESPSGAPRTYEVALAVNP